MKLAIVGCGSRHSMFRDSVSQDYPDQHEIVAMCDNNPHRLDLAAQAAARAGTNGIATYDASAFDAMIAEQKPDTVVITTPDFLHADYIVRAFEAGCDVICEKPMTIDLSSLKQITEAQKRTGRQVRVTFNYRYSPARTQIKDILASGTIGEVTAVDFRWHLDRVHGADYFRRWHRQKENSGGLLVHKSTHHFDLLNWWLGSTPTKVTATGRRAFYRPQTAIDMGLEARGPRCATCKVANKCDFELNLDEDAALRALYREAEHEDGYFRDLCVFDEDIGIEDTMQAHITYGSGATANYTLTAYSPWEGLEIRFQGTRGELIHKHVEVHGVFGGERAHAGKEAVWTEVHLAGKAPEQIEVPVAEGHHGGADPVMLGYIFDPDNMEPDRYNRASDHVAGGWSILTGIAANLSIETGATVDVQTMLDTRGITLE
ncbi:Gfo/Idh/MocA family protein [Celeribacter marinus]|uniref:Myo-inositol 2-dehydrogenase 1 n=1 Tax=Celeribacter marinus TaxID=1397108 RepID=A0A0N7HIU5_9RHOB|nr:Gfo/Idh/MocA family oxidoreductase [Celeribacter marinus]ALI56197.1 myo-inositol 2-dehydrogenase 1 [Celeribacter marinus]SFK85401.1 Oxidoreductase family, C-terminal alpha/beta domain [Celeribacter marinus]